jgi:uncharacterized protein
MLRTFFRKYLPTHATISSNRWIARYGSYLKHHNMWHLHRRSVAGGVAVGMFAGLVPGSNPVQFTAAALLAIAFRVNLPIAVIVTLYTNPFTIVPLYYLAFRLGKLVLMETGGSLPISTPGLDGKNLSEWLPAALDWLTSIGKPLLVGLPLLALLFSVTGYVTVRWAWRIYVLCAWRRRHKSRTKQSS